MCWSFAFMDENLGYYAVEWAYESLESFAAAALLPSFAPGISERPDAVTIWKKAWQPDNRLPGSAPPAKR
jgi:hypothetical protein